MERLWKRHPAGRSWFDLEKVRLTCGGLKVKFKKEEREKFPIILAAGVFATASGRESLLVSLGDGSALISPKS